MFVSLLLELFANQRQLVLSISSDTFNNYSITQKSIKQSSGLLSNRSIIDILFSKDLPSFNFKDSNKTSFTNITSNNRIIIKDRKNCNSNGLAKLTYPIKTKLTEPPIPRTVALPHTHSHNDYEHKYPLLNALSYGFVSIEVDIWLFPDDGENLRIAHFPLVEPTTLPTLKKLYLDPLRNLKEKLNNGGIYADGTPLTLLIDIKSAGFATYKRLDKILTKYEASSPGLFTTYSKGSNGNYIVNPGAVSIIVSGNSPRELLESQKIRYANFDGRKRDIGEDTTATFMPLISDSWNKLFTDNLAWDGTGTIPQDTKTELDKIISQVHRDNKVFRLWDLPQDSPNVWRPLYEAGVDLINTDNLAGLANFIESQTFGQCLN